MNRWWEKKIRGKGRERIRVLQEQQEIKESKKDMTDCIVKTKIEKLHGGTIQFTNLILKKMLFLIYIWGMRGKKKVREDCKNLKWESWDKK